MPPARRPLRAACLAGLLLASLHPALAAGPRWELLTVGGRFLNDWGVVAAGENGLLYVYGSGFDRFSADAGATWRKIDWYDVLPDLGPRGYFYYEELPGFAVEDGTVHAVDNINPFGLMYRRSTDHGETWRASRRVDRRQRREIDFARPSVAADGEAVYVAWDSCLTKYVDGAGFITSYCRVELASRPDARSRWRRTRLMDFGFLPVVKADAGVVHLVIQGDHLPYRRSVDGGLSWSDPVALSETRQAINGGFFSAVAVQGSRVAVAWSGPSRRRHDGDIFIRTSADAGLTWDRPRRVRRTRGSSQEATLAIAGDRLLLAWVDRGDRGAFRVWFAESSDRGRSWKRVRRWRSGRVIWGKPALVADEEFVHLFYPAEPEGQRERLVYRRRALD